MSARQSLASARLALLGSMQGLVSRGVDLKRICRIAAITDSPEEQPEPLLEILGAEQRPDGGWGDAEETAWCLRVLRRSLSEAREGVDAGKMWLSKNRSEGGGWGLTRRDRPRVPTTSLVLQASPEIGMDDDYRWLQAAWRSDMSMSVQLTYKGGFVLRAMSVSGSPAPDDSLISETVGLLLEQQSDDGGFAPWKGHPIGSDPWSTGICLVGICSFPELASRDSVERAVRWLCRTQLPSGFWPYHFIDEGSAYAYWGLTEAIRFLELS